MALSHLILFCIHDQSCIKWQNTYCNDVSTRNLLLDLKVFIQLLFWGVKSNLFKLLASQLLIFWANPKSHYAFIYWLSQGEWMKIHQPFQCLLLHFSLLYCSQTLVKSDIYLTKFTNLCSYLYANQSFDKIPI